MPTLTLGTIALLSTVTLSIASIYCIVYPSESILVSSETAWIVDSFLVSLPLLKTYLWHDMLKIYIGV